MDRNLDASMVCDILCKLRNGNCISQEDALEIISKVKCATLDKKIIPSITSSSQISSSFTSTTTQNYTPIPIGKVNNVITKSKIFHASSDIARTFVVRDVIYLAVCESKTSNWWASSSKALCIAFKSRSETKDGVFRVFLLEFGENYSLSISGPMADEHILKEYPVVSEVYVLTKVSVDNITDHAKVSMMVRDDSMMDLVGGKINGILTGVLSNCIKFYGDPNGSVVNAKYLATKFQKVASESLDTRLQPSKVERQAASASSSSDCNTHTTHRTFSYRRRKHKKLQTQ